MASNTLLSDINELYLGYVLNKNKWYGVEEKNQFERRINQVDSVDAAISMAKAEMMATAFDEWARKNGYFGNIVDVFWTARPNSITRIVGYPVDQKKNPTDILVKYTGGPSNGFLGLSAKASKTTSAIGFKNPGVGTIDKSLNLKLNEILNNKLNEVILMYGLPASAVARKPFIRANIKIKGETEKEGTELMRNLRDILYAKLKSMKNKDLLDYLLKDWMNADVMIPPYIKVSAVGTKMPFRILISDPTDNEKLKALSLEDILVTNMGNDTIGIKAGNTKIMKIRFKFESQKFASSLKLSGEPWN